MSSQSGSSKGYKGKAIASKKPSTTQWKEEEHKQYIKKQQQIAAQQEQLREARLQKWEEKLILKKEAEQVHQQLVSENTESSTTISQHPETILGDFPIKSRPEESTQTPETTKPTDQSDSSSESG